MARTRSGTEFEERGIAASERSREDLRSFTASEDAAAEELERLKDATESPEYAEAERRFENARLRKEIFIWEHDSTGAWKGDRLGRDILEMTARTEKGSMFVVNMGELDRLNDVSHAFGDAALTELRKRISAELATALGEEGGDGRVKIYRIASNDFAVTLEGIDDPELVRRVTADLETHPIEPAPGVEGAPIAVSAVSFDHAREIFNRLPTKGERDPREFVSCVREVGQLFSDFEKTRRRVGRLAEKIGENDPAAEELYTKYLQKTVGGLFREKSAAGSQSFSEFAESLRARGGTDPTREAEWESAIFDAAREDALRQFYARSTEKRGFAAAVLEFAEQEFERRADAEQKRVSKDFRRGFESAPTSERLAEARPESLAEFDKLLASRDQGFGPTEGETLLAQKRAEIAALEPQGPSLDLENCELELRLLIAQRDGRIGLGLRGLYFERLKDRVAENKPTSVIAIDMAFLKFFDRDGGTKTGDRAILAAGRILDAVARSCREKHPNLEIDAYRKGGDEFAVLVGSADPKVVEDVQKLIRLKTLDLGPIPADDGGTGGYLPTELQFNFGVARAETPKAEKSVDVSADELDQLADGAISSDKALNRYVFLVLKRVRAALIKDPDARRVQEAYIKNLTERSEKALLAGSAPVLELATRLLAQKDEILKSGAPVDEAARAIIDLVRNAIGKEKADQEAFGKAAEEAFAHQLEVALLHVHVEELIRRLESERERSTDLERTISELRAAVVAATVEKEKIVDLRQRIATSRG